MSQQVVGGGKSETELLHDVGAGVVDMAAVDGKHTELGQVGLGVFDKFLSLLVALLLATLKLAVEQGAAVDVVVDAAFNLFGVVTALFGNFDKELQCLDGMFATGEVHLAGFEVDAIE